MTIRHKGFTLAEVLITLAVVGVVAAMTMPVLVAKIQKEVTKQKLLKTQAILEEAYTRMVADANPMDATGVANAIQQGDLSKYVKMVKGYILSNGTGIVLGPNFGTGRGYGLFIYINGRDEKPCRGLFMFTVGPDYMTHRLVHPLGTYDSLVGLLSAKNHEAFLQDPDEREDLGRAGRMRRHKGSGAARFYPKGRHLPMACYVKTGKNMVVREVPADNLRDWHEIGGRKDSSYGKRQRQNLNRDPSQAEL